METRSRLLALPRELRDLIWLFTACEEIPWDRPDYKGDNINRYFDNYGGSYSSYTQRITGLVLLRTSKQIQEETASIFWHNNMFGFEPLRIAAYLLDNRVPYRRKQRWLIRHVSLVSSSKLSCDCKEVRGYIADTREWCWRDAVGSMLLLRSLSSLEIPAWWLLVTPVLRIIRRLRNLHLRTAVLDCAPNEKTADRRQERRCVLKCGESNITIPMYHLTETRPLGFFPFHKFEVARPSLDPHVRDAPLFIKACVCSAAEGWYWYEAHNPGVRCLVRYDATTLCEQTDDSTSVPEQSMEALTLNYDWKRIDIARQQYLRDTGVLERGIFC